MRKSGYVQLNLPQTFFKIVLGKQTVLTESRVVDQYLQLKTGTCRLIENICDGSGFSQIGGENQRTGAMGLLKFGCKLSKPVAVSGDEHKVRTFAREDAGELQSNARRGAGDESGFAVSGRHS